MLPRRLFPILCLVLAIAVPPAAIAALADAQSPVRVASGLTLDIESIQQRIKKVEASDRLDADVKAAALRQYQAAVEQLELVSNWNARLEALQAIQRDQPQLLAAAQRELAAAPTAADVEIPPDATLDTLDPRLAEAAATLESLRGQAGRIDEELRLLADRRMRLPAELASARAGRESLLSGPELPALPSSSAEAAIAQRAASLAELRTATRRTEALELEQAMLEPRRELLEARRDLLRAKIERQRLVVDALGDAANVRRAAEAQKAAEEAAAIQASLERVDPVLGRLAQESAKLATRRSGPDGLVTSIERANADLAEAGQLLTDVDERAGRVRQKAEAADYSDAVGLLLRKERADLPDVADARGRIRARQAAISDAQLQLLTLEDLRADLPHVEAEVAAILERQSGVLPADEHRRIAKASDDMLAGRRESLDALIRDYNVYFTTLVDLDARERQLVEAVQSYRSFLDEHVLWIRNTQLPRLGMIAEIAAAATWMVQPTNVQMSAARIADKARTDPLFVSLALLAWGIALLLRPRAKRQLAELCRSRGGAPLAATLAALLLTALLAALWPLLLRLLAWIVESAPSPPDDYSRALAETLRRTSVMMFGLEFLRRLAAKGGPARSFLAFPENALAVMRRQILLLEAVMLPALAVAYFFDHQPESRWADSMGRAAFLVGMGSAAVIGYRMLSTSTPIGATLHRRVETAWASRAMLRAYWFPIAAAVFVAGLSLVGYDFTARQLAQRLWWSAWWVFLFLLANAVMVRWLAGARQDLAERKLEDGGTVVVTRSEGDVEVRDDIADLSLIGSQSRQLLRLLIGAGITLSLFLVWADVVPALRVLQRVELWSVTATVAQPAAGTEAAKITTTRVPVTAANLLVAAFALVLVGAGSRNLPALLEMLLLQRTRLDQGLRYAITTLARYAIWIAGTVVFFRNLGVAWSHVQWLVAAISVGLGFGLQEIFGNFVSGLILLFERPVRVGDTVTLGGVSGTVSRLSMRATTIVDFDRKELIVPNKEFITGQLVNWSLSDSVLRLVIPVGVAYGSDTALVVRLLDECAKQCAEVLEDPRPTAFCVRFGESGIDFELRVFVEGSDAVARTRHELHVAIDRKFRSAGVEISSPARDVRIRSVDSPLPVTLQTS